MSHGPMNQSPYNPGDLFIGRYRVERVLGAGNMGIVLAATHIGLEQRVAIKFMLPGKAPAEQYQRFLREARACAKLKTQHVAKVLDVGTTPEGAPYMIIEYLDGRDLAAELAARGPLPFAEAVECVLQACEAIAEAHAAGIVHRDLKPANMFLTRTPDGAPCVKVLDFGISKMRDNNLALTSDMQALGSPLYMSPEQIDSAKDVDARSDIWALCASLYELVAGYTPFHATRMEELLARVFRKPPTPLSTYRNDIPAGFEAVLFQGLEKDRERRFPSVAALAAALAAFGPPHAAAHVARIGALLGEQAAPARPTAVIAIPPQPDAAPPEAVGTASAVMLRPAAATTPSAPRRSAATVLAVVLGAVMLGAAGLVGWRARTSAPASVGSVAPAPLPPAPSAAPPAVPPAPTEPERVEADAGAMSTPAASAPAPAASAKLAPSAPRRNAPAPHGPRVKSATTAAAHKDPYAR